MGQFNHLDANTWWADLSKDGRWVVFSTFDHRNEFVSLHEFTLSVLKSASLGG